MNPYIIPIFIPHYGCPQKCIFCNQIHITGRDCPSLSAPWVVAAIREGLNRKRKSSRTETQVAFYGGTFTGLDSSLQEEILSAVLPFWEEGKVHSIRLSTRPDYIDPERISVLKRYPVKTVEVGIQSMSDDVLLRTRRGHNSMDNLRAVRLLKEARFQVGAQIMIGLPGEDQGSLLSTLEPLFTQKPDFVRIYPVLVLKATVLASLYRAGSYRPLTLSRAVELCRDLFVLCRERGITVIRMGLQADAVLEENIVAGPYHPAFGQMVLAEVLKKEILKKLQDFRGSGAVKIRVSPSAVSLLMGFKKRVLNDLRSESRISSLKILTDQRLGWEEFHVTAG